MKHHNNLTDDQIHNAKGFEPARKRTISTKDVNGEVDWVKANYISMIFLTAIADQSGSLHHRYFCLYSSYNANKYAVYMDINGGEAMALPTGYDAVIRCDATGTGQNSTAGEIGDAIQVGLDAHADFVASDNNLGVVTITGTDNLISTTPPIDIDAGFSFSVTDSEVFDEVLTTDSSGAIKFVPKATFSSEIEDVEGTEVKSTGEAGGTKFLREDGDGTCSWQVPADLVGVNNIVHTTDSGSTTSADGNVTVNILGGTGIITSAGVSGVTISESEEKKSKADVEALLGVTGTDLGTFTGDTIGDSRDIKVALQDLETDHEVEKGKSYHHKSLRYSANNLDGTSSTGGENDAWAFTEMNNNSHNKFSIAVDTADMSYQTALRTCIEVPITGVTSKLIGGTCASSGESGNAHKVTIWKADFDGGSGASGLAPTLIGTFSIDGSSNTAIEFTNIVLNGAVGATTLADGDGVLILMEDIELHSDMDCRGTVTLRFEDTF